MGYEGFTSRDAFASESNSPLKETLILATSVLLVYTPFHGLKALQSSLNQQEGMGVTSLASFYFATFTSSFLTPAIMHKVGVKVVIVGGLLIQGVYVACNFYQHWVTLILGSVLAGFSQCPWWTSVMMYLTALADVTVSMDTKKQTTFHTAFSRLSGIYNAFFVGCNLFGGVMSSFIFFNFSEDQDLSNTTIAKSSYCGVTYCPAQSGGQQLPTPEQAAVHKLLFSFFYMDAAGVALAVMFLPDLKRKDKCPGYNNTIRAKLHAYWEAFKNADLMFCVPVMISNTMNFSLKFTMFTEAYVSCALGIKMVGYVVATWGLSTTVFSGAFGIGAKLTGRQSQMALAMLTDTAILVACLLWRPHADHLELFFLIAVAMGLSDGIWIVQLTGLVACLFPENTESGLSVKATWSSLVLASAFTMASFLCPRSRIIVALVVAGIAVVCYVKVEVSLYAREKWAVSKGTGYIKLDGSDPQGETSSREETTSNLAES